MKRTSQAIVLAVAAAVALTFGVFAAVGSASTSRATANTKVLVAASEFKFVLSKKVVPAGTVTFVVTNKGTAVHDFKIKGKKTAFISPGKSATLKIALAKGKYPYLCTVPGHAAAGMKGVVTVK